MNQTLAWRRSNAISIAAAAVMSVWLVLKLRDALLNKDPFDDAYMFYRYAVNIRHGLGISWNLDGVPTYGQTALLWGAVVLVGSYLPIAARTLLVTGSWLCGLGALVAMAWVVARNARTAYLRSVWRVLPLVALPVCFLPSFYESAMTGMETLLAVLMNTIYLGCALGWVKGKVSPVALATVGLACFLTRPDSAVCVVLVPVLLHLLLGQTSLRSLMVFLGAAGVELTAELIVCKLYFHTSLPLSFYMKSRHAYEGYANDTKPFVRLMEMMSLCWLNVAALALFSGKTTWRLSAACLLPVAITFVYFFTSVTQIMGMWGRYYLPYLPYIVIASFLALDGRFADFGAHGLGLWSSRALALRSAICLLLLAFVAGLRLNHKRLLLAIDKRLSPTAYAYDPVTLKTSATQPLEPIGWARSVIEVSDLLAKPLPRGATIAATEVGYLSVAAPQVNVIDMAGLNDTQFALNGFKVADLLARRPDIIWMPHNDYTYQRGEMLTNSALLAQYEVYAGAADYGIAIRRDSPYKPQIDRALNNFWKTVYPNDPIDDHRVSASSWTRDKQIYIELKQDL